MKKRAWPFILALALSACETTGDPHQGGLFGWSETKAKRRITEKEEALTHRQNELERERATSARLRHVTDSHPQPTRSEAPSPPNAPVRKDEFASATADATRIEHQSPTVSGSSRARRLRDEIEDLRVDPALSPEDKMTRLHLLQSDLARLRASLNLSP